MKHIDIVIETPGGSMEKYNYDPVTGFFKLKKVLAQGMCFPYDFGFIPGTKGEDGDPLDAMVISEFKTYPGCMMECRMIGCIQAAQQEKDKPKKTKNDRFIAIPVESVAYRHFKTIKELPVKMLKQLQDFFINYNKEEGKRFIVTKINGPSKALKLIGAYNDA